MREFVFFIFLIHACFFFIVSYEVIFEKQARFSYYLYDKIRQQGYRHGYETGYLRGLNEQQGGE